MQELLPAVFVLGPPHSGKSVLAYSLSQALRERRVPHYLLRAAPDGEGDWFVEGPRDLVHTLRVKHQYTPAFVRRMAQHIQDRQLPLLVDSGGRPTPEQVAMIFSQATHGILLLPKDGDRFLWESIIERYHIPLLADLTSRLSGKTVLYSSSQTTPIRGVLVGLERGQRAKGEVFSALVRRVATLFEAYRPGLRSRHHRAAPSGATIVDAEEILQRIRGGAQVWEVADLIPLRSLLPAAKPLAFYGRAPVWVVATVAIAALPSPFYFFDARYGWVEACHIHRDVRINAPLYIVAHPERGGWTRVQIRLRTAELPYVADLYWPLPLPSTSGVIIDGKMPFWLLAGLVRFYAEQGKQVAVFQARIGVDVRVTWV